MRHFEIRITREAEKDIYKLSPKLKNKLYDILTEVLAIDPFQGKKLVGDLVGSYSYRPSYQDRIVYSIDPKNYAVYIERSRTHYGN
jgi:mRNA-degrading endonuclease RelE of RelBE toxin-antitoxin system